MSLCKARSSSRSPERSSDSEGERVRSPSPPSTSINEECHRGSRGVFIKHWYRGNNTCSRCDFEFILTVPLIRKNSDKQSKLSSHQSHNKQPSNVSIKEERKFEIKKEEKLSPVPKKKPTYDSADAQITSSLMGGIGGLGGMGGPPMPPYVMDHPAFRGMMYPMIHDPTPALRQLSEYAKPHISVNQERNAAGLGLYPLLDPYSRLSGMCPPSAKERLELELEKRERSDIRNRESWEMRDKIKAEIDTKLTGLERTPSCPSVGSFDANLAKKRYGSTGPSMGTPSFLPSMPMPGSYPTSLIAAEWAQRERERLELLGMPSLPRDSAEMADRFLAAERAQSDRLTLPTDPIYRLEMGGLSSGIVPSEPTHTTHTHSHTHLHLHQPDAAIYPPFHPLVGSSPHVMPSPAAFNLPGVDSLAAANATAAANAAAAASSNTAALQGLLPLGPIPHPSYSLAASQQLLAAAREQEILYRELLSRPPYSTDPMMAQQLMVQAMAQQEAFQRQLSIERENLGLHSLMFPR